MADYHVNCGALGIYAGTVNANKTQWKNKSDVTDEAINAVRDYMVQELLGGTDCSKGTNEGYEWDLADGRRVQLRIIIINNEGDDG